jgi:hypothetical protein
MDIQVIGNEIDEKSLEIMKCSIDKMNKTQHIEILKILKLNKAIKINENRNGIYINLSFLPMETILELNKYIIYIEEQEKSLEIDENQKIELSYIIS